MQAALYMCIYSSSFFLCYFSFCFAKLYIFGRTYDAIVLCALNTQRMFCGELRHGIDALRELTFL